MSDETTVLDKPMFAGVPLDRFCGPCSERMRACIRDGKLGIAGLCDACTAIIDAANPVLPATHPAPWRWLDVERRAAMMTSGAVGDLIDADGNSVLNECFDVIDEIGWYEPTPQVRALIVAAPEMRDLLRDLVAARTNDWDPMEPGLTQLRVAKRKATGILARIDAPPSGIAYPIINGYIVELIVASDLEEKARALTGIPEVKITVRADLVPGTWIAVTEDGTQRAGEGDISVSFDDPDEESSE